MTCKLAKAFAFFGLMVTVGYHTGTRSWNGVIHLTDGALFEQSRVPAAIKKELDFSSLNGAELITATQKRLVSAARVLPQEDGIGVELGHFVTRSEDGKRKLACDSLYNRVTLRFEAEGVAEAGEKPSMTIDSPCRINFEDINAIDPIWIPSAKILKERPSDMDLSYDEDVKFHFESVGSRWPLRWTLQSVRLYNSADIHDTNARDVRITNTELREIRKKPLVILWKDTNRIPAESTEK